MLTSSKKYFPTLCFLSALAVVLVVYAQVMNHHFLDWDDMPAYLNNPHLQQFSAANLWWIFTSAGDGIWKPLTYFSFLLEFHWLDVSRPGIHLLVNPLMHAANATLVGCLVYQVLSLLSVRNTVWYSPLQTLLAGLLACVWFAAHPLNVEASAWLSGRKELLSAFFYLACVLCWVRYLHANAKTSIWLAMALLCQLLSLLCKSMAVSIPLVLLLLDLLAQRNEPWWKLISEKWPFWLLSFLIIPVAIWGQHSVGALPDIERVSVMVRLAQGVDSYLMYLSKFIFPFKLLPYYPALSGVDIARFLAGIMILVIMAIVACLSLLKGSRIWLFVFGWYFLVFFPVAGWVQIATHRSADRYAYLPMVPFYGVMSVTLIHLLANHIRILVLCIVIISCGLASLAYQQTRIWREDRTLWEYTLEQIPTSPLVLLNLGVVYRKAGENDKAIIFFKRASDMASGDIYYLETWMIACSELHRWECALDAAMTGIRKYPDDYHFFEQAGYFLSFLGRYAEAEKFFSEAITLQPDCLTAIWGNAYVLSKSGKNKEALVALKHLLDIDPGHSKGKALQQVLLSKQPVK